MWENRDGAAGGGVATESAGARVPRAMSASRQFTISRLARIDGEWGSAGSAYGDPGEGSTGRLSAYPVSEYIRYNPVVKWNVIVVRREPATFDQATPRDAPRPQGRLIGLHPGRIDLPRDVFKRLSCARTPKRLPLAKAGSSRPRAERPDEMRIVNGSYISPRPERSRENLRQADAAKR